MLQGLKIKVCGMTNAENVAAVCRANPDYLGYIFYSKSVRYVGAKPDPEMFNTVPFTIQKVGVFVNEYPEKILELTKRFGLNVIQMHGIETPETCKMMRNSGISVIKVFPGDQLMNVSLFQKYEDAVDYFLFDTPVISYGGSGRKFDWEVLKKIRVSKPYFLSGGINEYDADTILSLGSRSIYAIDINSRFESAPGIKDPEKIEKFINDIRNEK